MSDVQVRASLQIRKGQIDHRSNPTFYTATLTGEKGPTPGAVTCTVEGTDIDLSELTTPGWATIQNMDSSNYVEVGIYDPEALLFYPFLELGPGEILPVKFSRNFGEEYTGVTGTSAPTNRLRVKANGASCVVVVNAFEK